MTSIAAGVAGATIRTPFEPLPRVPAETPLVVAVLVAFVPYVATIFADPMPSDAGVALGVVVGAALGVAVAYALRAAHVRALVAFAVATTAFALGAAMRSHDIGLAPMCAVPIAVLLLVVVGPLALVASVGRREPDALEHNALTAAVWLLLAAGALSSAAAHVAVAVAALLALWTAARDAWRAVWLLRARAGAIHGVRLRAPWPGASTRVELTSASGDGPFRRAERVDRSEIVHVAWLRFLVALGVLAVAMIWWGTRTP